MQGGQSICWRGHGHSRPPPLLSFGKYLSQPVQLQFIWKHRKETAQPTHLTKVFLFLPVVPFFLFPSSTLHWTFFQRVILLPVLATVLANYTAVRISWKLFIPCSIFLPLQGTKLFSYKLFPHYKWSGWSHPVWAHVVCEIISQEKVPYNFPSSAYLLVWSNPTILTHLEEWFWMCYSLEKIPPKNPLNPP